MSLGWNFCGAQVARVSFGLYFPAVRGGASLTGYTSSTPWKTSQREDGINPQDAFSNPFPRNSIERN